MVTLGQVVRVAVQPSRVVSAARSRLGHYVLWAVFSVQAPTLKTRALRPLEAC